MKEKLVVTINRQFGSGGLKIGKRLAEELGVSCYDSEMLRLVSDNAGMEGGYLATDSRIKDTSLYDVAKQKYDEHPGEPLPAESDNYFNMKDLFLYQRAIIEELAERESCVIVGRCANFILKDRPDTVSVFIHASMDYRIRRASSVYNMEKTDLISYIKSVDRHKSEYYKYYTGVEWKDATYYNISIDSSKTGISGAVEEIEKYIKAKFS